MFELKSADEAVNIAIQKGATGTPVHLTDDDIVWGIKETLSRANISAKDVVASVQSFATFSTVITLPYLSQQDIAQAITLEAKRYIPLPINEVILDWSIINTSATPPPATAAKPAEPSPKNSSPTPMVEVFMVAVPKVEALKYQNIIKNAGLNLRALEIENAALIRSIIGNDLGPTAIINIGGRSTSILIVDKGVERLNRNYEVGGFEITKSIATSMNINLKRAEQLKRTVGLTKSNDNNIKEAMSSLVDLIVFETKKTLHNYQDSKNIQIGKILLIGGLINMPGFYQYFKEKLSLEILQGNPTARIVIPSELESLRPELNSKFAIAFGLAMRKI